jgi:hypothetical protein
MNHDYLIPINKELKSQATIILKGHGLDLLKPKFFKIDSKKVEVENFAYDRDEAGVVGGNGGYDIKSGFLGMPVWDLVTLVANPYTTDDGTVINTKSQLQLPVALCEVSNVRNIIKTTIAGRNGTIKEYMSDGDYTVNIKGSLVSQYSNIPPSELMYELKTIIEHPEALQVYANFLEYFDVTWLVVEEPIVRQREGCRNVVDFELRCSSDRPVTLDA